MKALGANDPSMVANLGVARYLDSRLVGDRDQEHLNSL